MIYNEKYVATVATAKELISILNEKVPTDATVDIASYEYCSGVEVWYDKDTNTVLFK